jgi:SAM-dependent methyltransferase
MWRSPAAGAGAGGTHEGPRAPRRRSWPAAILKSVKRALVSVLRSALRPFGWAVAPAPVLDQELNSTAVVRGAARALAAGVRSELDRRGFAVADAWLLAVEDEIRFWFGYFATEGIEYGGRGSIEAASRPYHFQFEDLFPGLPRGSSVAVLDVGAGPMSRIGTLSDALHVKLRAVDPLAPAYDSILAFFGLKCPVSTEFGMAEHLLSQFAEGSFDLVHARNALDHALDPLACIGQMARLVGPGGWLVLDHADREGDQQGFQGLHQWNLFVSGGQYRIEDASGRALAFDHATSGLSARFEQYVSDGKQCTRAFFQRRRET